MAGWVEVMATYGAPYIKRFKWGPMTSSSACILSFLALRFVYRKFHKDGGYAQSFSNRQLIDTTIRALTTRHIQTMILASILMTWGARALKLPFAPRRLLPTFFATVWALFYTFNVVERPVLRYVRTRENVRLVEKARLFRQYFPVFWMGNRHAMTVLPSVLSELWFWLDPRHDDELYQERITTFDGEKLSLDWAVSNKAASKENGQAQVDDYTPIVLIAHGLGGSTAAPYIRQLAACCKLRGWRCVSVDYWRADFAEHRDIEAAVEHIRTRNPSCPIFGVGFSAGGHILLRYLQQAGTQCQLAGAVTVSATCDLVRTLRWIEQESPGIYKRFVVEGLTTCIQRHAAEATENLMKDQRALILASIAAEKGDPENMYDQFLQRLPSYTGKHSLVSPEMNRPAWLALPSPGLNPEERSLKHVGTAGHYLHTVNCCFDTVAVPTVMLHSEDDPIVGCITTDWDIATLNPTIISIILERGGHTGYSTGFFPVGPSYADKVSLDFFAALL